LRIYNQYVLYLTILTSLVNTLLAFGGQESLDVYFIMNTIAYLSITLICIRLDPRAMKALDIVGCTLFSGIVVIVVVKAIHIVSHG